MPEYMHQGGPLMWLILFCSVLAGAVFLERVSYFHRITVRVGEFMRGLANLVEHRRFAEAQMECASTATPVTGVIHSAILRHQATRAELMAQNRGMNNARHRRRRARAFHLRLGKAPVLDEI